MATVRITGGTLRGRRIDVPADGVRPTSERARQAYFNIVGPAIDGARFLDLFSGTGIFSMEALSRGARAAVAVESSPKQAAAITKYAQKFGLAIEVITRDAVSAIGSQRNAFDLVYADPPYDFAGYDALVGALDELTLAPDAMIAIEHRRRSAPWEYQPRNLAYLRRAEYGEVWITFYSATAEPDEAAATPFAVASDDPVRDTGNEVEDTEW